MKAETIAELQIWIEGEFALVHQGRGNTDKDLAAVRGRVHDLSNEVAKVAAVCSPDKLAKIVEHDADIELLKAADIARRSSVATIKTTYAVLGATLGTLVTVLLAITKVIHP